MSLTYTFTHAQNDQDAEKLNALYTSVFKTNDVGRLAVALFHHLPGMSKKDWFLARENLSGELAAALALIPHTWQMGGVKLKVAEMGLVGTLEEHRGRGLMRELNARFDQTLKKEAYDLAVIQGIPGFYHRFGFYYAVAMENHIHLPLHVIAQAGESRDFMVRRAQADDIPFLLREDKSYRRAYLLTTVRDAARWRYLFSHGLETECGSDFWIIEDKQQRRRWYSRIARDGFGQGLIITEVSETICHAAWMYFLSFCGQRAQTLGKPYIRLNLHTDTTPVRTALYLGAGQSNPYAWQVKLPDAAGFLKKISPLLEKRLAQSCFAGFSETLRLDLFNHTIDLVWQKGLVSAVVKDGGGVCPCTFCVPADLLPALVLGRRTWRELQHARPDIFPAHQYVRPELTPDKSGLLMDVLFPARRSWIYSDY